MVNNKWRLEVKTTKKIIAGLFLISNSITATAATKYTAVNLDELGFGDISVAAINDSGSFAGSKIKSDGYPGELAIWSNGKEVVIDQSKIDLGPVMDLNNKSQVLSFNNTTQNQGIIYDNGKFSTLPTLGGNVGGPWDINNHGQVAGYSSTSRGTGYYEIHATLWDNGKPIDLGTAKGNFTSTAYALNDNSDVVGYSGNFAVRWSGGKALVLDALDGSHAARAHDINNIGQIIGESFMNNGLSYATFWDKGSVTATALGTLGGAYSAAGSINDLGQIVGYSSIIDDGHQIPRGFIWEDGHMIDINNLMDNKFLNSNYIITGAGQITNNGMILATGFNTSDGTQNDFLLRPISPVPEPTTWAMLLAGLGLMGFMIKRKMVNLN